MDNKLEPVNQVLGETPQKWERVERNPDGTIKKGALNPGGRPKFIVEFRELLKKRCYKKAVDKLESCLDSQDEKIGLMATKEVFELLGLKGVQLVDEAGNGLRVGVIILPSQVDG